MKHILEGHHPKYFNPKSRIKYKQWKSKISERNTLFPKNMTEKDVEQVLIKILQQEKNEISRLDNETPYWVVFRWAVSQKGQKDIIVDGKKYVIGFQEEFISNGMRYRRVGQFYPKVMNP